jgi:hypothetical protein
MLLISHRGNLNGKSDLENDPTYVSTALSKNYDVEIDIWYVDHKLYLGHDEPQYEIDLEWLLTNISKLWIHCKNANAIIYFNDLKHPFNYFWHENDLMTLTSKKFMWVYPGKQPIKNSIAVMPEKFGDDTTNCYGICSDYVENYTIKK